MMWGSHNSQGLIGKPQQARAGEQLAHSEKSRCAMALSHTAPHKWMVPTCTGIQSASAIISHSDCKSVEALSSSVLSETHVCR